MGLPNNLQDTTEDVTIPAGIWQKLSPTHRNLTQSKLGHSTNKQGLEKGREEAANGLK